MWTLATVAQNSVTFFCYLNMHAVLASGLVLMEHSEMKWQSDPQKSTVMRESVSLQVRTIRPTRLWNPVVSSKFEYLFQPATHGFILSTLVLDCDKSRKDIILAIKMLKIKQTKYWKNCEIQPKTGSDSNHQSQIYPRVWDVQYTAGFNFQIFNQSVYPTGT